MRFKNWLLVILFLLMFGLSSETISAFAGSGYSCTNCIVYPKTNDSYGKTWILQRNDTAGYVYCLQKGATAPHAAYIANLNECYTINDSLVTSAVRAQIGWVLKYNDSKVSAEDLYAAKQSVIHKIMNENGVGNAPDSYNSDIYNAANTVKTQYNSKLTITLGEFSLVGNNYEATYSIGSFFATPTITTSHGTVDSTNKKIIVPASSVNSATSLDVTVTATYTKSYDLAVIKTCPNYQALAETTKSDSKPYSNSDTKTIDRKTKLTIIYYKEKSDKANNIAPLHTDDKYIYGNRCENGLYNYSANWGKPEIFKVTKTGYTPTGYWTTFDDQYTIHETYDPGSCQALAAALGKDITTSDQVVEVYGHWNPNTYNVIYHGQDGRNSDGQETVTDPVTYDSNFTIFDEDTFKYTDHVFLGWSTDSNASPGSSVDVWKPGNTYKWNRTSDLDLYAVWQDACKYYFKPYDKWARIELYHNLQTKKRKLLDFNIINADEACTAYTPNYNKSESCLDVDSVNSDVENNFNSNNLSDFNDTINPDTLKTEETKYKDGFCLVDFELEIGSTVEYDPLIVKKAGTMVLEVPTTTNEAGETIPGNVAKGIISKVCFIHNDKYDEYSSEIGSDGKYKNLIKHEDYGYTIKLNGEELEKTGVKNAAKGNDVKGEFHRVWQRDFIYYKPNLVYAEKITGLTLDKSECIDSGVLNKKCRILGYGVASRFIDGDSKTNPNPNFDFEIEFTGDKSKNIFSSYDEKIETASENNCPYKVEEEIIEYPDSNPEPEGNLELEFRSIDPDKPFERDTKSNWCNTPDECGKNNTTVTNTITNRNNSYNRTGEGSLYGINGSNKIILTPDLIQKIRNYNANTGDQAGKNHSYEDYTVYSFKEDGETKKSTEFFDYIGIVKIQ